MIRATAFAFSTLIATASLVAQWGPLQATSAPAPRSDALLAYDLLNQRTLMFGGNLTNEFWALTGNAWTQLTPAVLPPARRYSQMCSDVFNGQAYLFGGQGNASSATALDDLWRWDGAAWQQLAPAFAPAGLMWHSMAFDSSRTVLVVFGGRRNIFSQNEYLDETWEYSPATNQWNQGFAPQSPPACLRSTMAFHPILNQVILFGGEDANGNALGETWTYDGANWTQINQTGVTPPARMSGRLVANLTQNLTVLVGGRDPLTFGIFNDTWEHDGTQWREITSVYGGIYPPRAETGVAHDLARNRIISFGGKIANQGLRNDTWEYGAQWLPFGMGCAGSAGTPTFTPGATPTIGMTATAEIGNVPPAIPVAFMAIGLSRTQWALGNLPALLTGFGMPGCRTYTSADLIASVPAQNGIAAWSFAVPQQPVFVGETFHLQGITFDPGINALGLAVSPAATMVIGN